MQCTILGCGGSGGVPQINCHCVVCTSDNPKNKRLRCSILIESETTTILIDTSPDLRQQALQNHITSIDAVLYTHAHSDHIVGVDDVRFLSHHDTPIDAFMEQHVAQAMEQKFPHIFKQLSKWYKPRLTSKVFDIADGMFMVGDIAVLPLNQIHGGITSCGFRCNDIAYSTDCNALPESAFKVLAGVKIWIVDCLRYHCAPTHSNLEKTLGWIARIKPDLAILTHMDHNIEYEELITLLPAGVVPAYDGMKVRL